jgi:hypothetical protein
MSQLSEPLRPTPREPWRIEKRLYREQETPLQPDEIQETLSGSAPAPSLRRWLRRRQRWTDDAEVLLVPAGRWPFAQPA